MKSRDRLFHPQFPRGPGHTADDDDNVIGRGKFGKIVAVKAAAEGEERVAIKIMHKRTVIEQKMVRQVLEEQSCQALCSQHQNVLPLLESQQDAHRLYMVFPLCPTSLAKILSPSSALPSNLLHVALRQISSALNFVHDLGVVHRDVKTENVLVSPCGATLKLSDFGLSKRLQRRRRTKTVCGTLQYMAPEVLEERAYGHSADWWSFGVLAHRLTTGGMPWPKGKDHREQLRLLDLRSVDLSRCQSEQVREVIVACFDPDEEARDRVARMAEGMKMEGGERQQVNFLDVKVEEELSKAVNDTKGNQN